MPVRRACASIASCRSRVVALIASSDGRSAGQACGSSQSAIADGSRLPAPDPDHQSSTPRQSRRSTRASFLTAAATSAICVSVLGDTMKAMSTRSVIAARRAVLDDEAEAAHQALELALEARVRLPGDAQVVTPRRRRDRRAVARHRQRVRHRPANRIVLRQIDQIAEHRGRRRQRARALAEQAQVTRRHAAQVDGVVFLFDRRQQVPRRQQQRLDGHVERAVDAHRARDLPDAEAHRLGEIAVGGIDVANAAHQEIRRAAPTRRRRDRRGSTASPPRRGRRCRRSDRLPRIRAAALLRSPPASVRSPCSSRVMMKLQVALTMPHRLSISSAR